MNYKKILTKKYLAKEYSDNGNSTRKIATKVGCSPDTVWKYLKKFNIKIRTISEAMPKSNITKKFLIKEYVKNKKSSYKIEKEFAFPKSTVYNYLQKYGIKTRTISEANKGELGNNFIDGRTLKFYNCIEPGCNNEISYACFKYGTGRCIACGNKHSGKERTGRKRPDLTEINEKRTGKNNPNFIDGKTILYPLGWNKTFKEQIRFRDGYKCQICGCPEVENGRKLSIHHKDYDKDNINPENLTSLCQSCHSKTNYNREYWIEYFQMNKTKGVLNDTI